MSMDLEGLNSDYECTDRIWIIYWQSEENRFTLKHCVWKRKNLMEVWKVFKECELRQIESKFMNDNWLCLKAIIFVSNYSWLILFICPCRSRKWLCSWRKKFCDCSVMDHDWEAIWNFSLMEMVLCTCVHMFSPPLVKTWQADNFINSRKSMK